MIRTAIKFMLYEKSKSLGILIGIIIAIFLIGQQLSTLDFLKSLMSVTIAQSDPDKADIWIITDQSNNANSLKPLDASLVQLIKSIDGIEETYPVVTANAMMKFDNGQFASVQLIGSEVPSMIAGPNPKYICEGDRNALTRPMAFTCETGNEDSFHHPVELGMHIELNGKRVQITALTKDLKGFGNALMYSTADNVRAVSGAPASEVNAIIATVRDKSRIEEVAEAVNKSFIGVKAWPRQQITDSTVNSILKETSMGASFMSLVIFAVISGFFIIGLTIYTATFDRIRDYGTLKAIGATNKYISMLVLTQAAIYGIVGYILAIAMLYSMKFGVESTGLVLTITPVLLMILLLMTLFISVGGSLLAVRKLAKLEPASVFK